MTAVVDVAPPSPADELAADTGPGSAMVAAAERFACRFEDGALARDRDGRFATEHLEALRRYGFLAAPIPAEFGGGGVDSIHDVIVAASRLARGDVATAIGVNMHFAVVLNIVGTWRRSVMAGRGDRARRIQALIERTVTDGIVYTSAVSEQSPQNFTRPRTTARSTGDGWVIDGHKVFATMAPSATLINTAVRIISDDGSERYGFALVPSAADGVTFNDDWDPVGMRASDSGSLTLSSVRLDTELVSDGFATGSFSTALYERFLASGAFHAAASLGVAESAQFRVVQALRRRDSIVDNRSAIGCLADNAVDLTAMQASLDLAARRIDIYFGVHAGGGATTDEAQAVTASVQAAKAFICAGAQRVTDRALALTGGAGYLAAHPLAKAWRDARAGAFMHPFGANRAYDLVARTSLRMPIRPEPEAG